MHDQTNPAFVSGSRRSHSYLLRVWQQAPDAPWRAMLRCVTTKEEYVFPDLAEMVAFLKREAKEERREA